MQADTSPTACSMRIDEEPASMPSAGIGVPLTLNTAVYVPGVLYAWLM